MNIIKQLQDYRVELSNRANNESNYHHASDIANLDTKVMDLIAEIVKFNDSRIIDIAKHPKLSAIQSEAFNKPCPNCGQEKWAHVVGNEDNSELYLWCYNCDVSMDSDGGYTN